MIRLSANERVPLAQIQITRSVQKHVELANHEQTQILVAESAVTTRILLSTLLQSEGYHVHAASTAVEVQEIIRQHGVPNLAILGVQLRDCDGATVARTLRQNADTPIIYLTNPNENLDLSTGKSTDDYLTKPFIAADLLARVRHRLFFRATSAAAHKEIIAIDDRLHLHLAQHYALMDNRRIELTPIETRLLDTLFQHRGRVLSPGFLMSKAWTRHQEGTLRSLWVHIRRLRSKIEPHPQHPRYVMTVRGQGYCLPRRPELDVVVQ